MVVKSEKVSRQSDVGWQTTRVEAWVLAMEDHGWVEDSKELKVDIVAGCDFSESMTTIPS